MNTEEKIKQVLHEQINQQLSLHNGSAELTGFTDGVARIKFFGACANCMAADDTFQNVVKSTIMAVVPEVKDVELDDTVSQDLLDMARKLLNGER